jgi:hypothetical protein
LAQLGDQVMSGELGFAPAGITAFHGTPHNILGKFDISKVGTGEGAQAYGHGMYFAQNPAVAGEYQKRLSADSALSYQSRNVDSAYISAANNFKEFGTSYEDTLKGLKQAYKQAPEKELEIAAKVAFQPTGNLYKVDVPDEYIPKMLDWDKPLKDQRKDVQSLLKEINPNISENDVGRVIYESFAKPSKLPENSPMIEFMRNNPELTPQAAASKFLNEKGIKGIRYLDEGSRIAPKYTGDPAFIYAGNDFKQNGYTLEEAFEGMKQAYKNEDFKEIKDALGEVYGVKPNQTSNFVVFEPTDVKMLERNNQPLEGLLD